MKGKNFGKKLKFWLEKFIMFEIRMDSKHVLAEQKIQTTSVENKPDLARMICRFYLKFYDSAHKLAH